MSLEDSRIRYLRTACMHLPPLGSDEREQMRTGLSLASMVEQIAQNAEVPDEELEMGE